MEKKEKLRKILCILFAFLLSLSLFAALFTGTLKLTLLDKDFFSERLEKSGYSQSLYGKIVEELSNEGYISGFDEAFFSQILSVEDINAPVLSSVDRIYGTGEYVAASTEEITETFFEEFITSLEGRSVVVDEEQKEQIKAFAAECATYLSSNARLPFLSLGESLVKTAKPLTTYALIFLSVFALFCVGFIVTKNPNKKESLRYLSYGLSATALMTATPAVVMLATGVLKKVSIADKGFYNLVQILGTDMSYIILAVAAVTLALSLILTAVYFITLKSNKQ